MYFASFAKLFNWNSGVTLYWFLSKINVFIVRNLNFFLLPSFHLKKNISLVDKTKINKPNLTNDTFKTIIRKGYGNEGNEKGEVQILVKNIKNASSYYIVRIRRSFFLCLTWTKLFRKWRITYTMSITKRVPQNIFSIT